MKNRRVLPINRRVNTSIRPTGTRPGTLVVALLAFFAVTPNTLAFQPACDSAVLWDTLPEYPISITNNAVTSTRNPDGSTTIYSFKGIISNIAVMVDIDDSMTLDLCIVDFSCHL